MENVRLVAYMYIHGAPFTSGLWQHRNKSFRKFASNQYEKNNQIILG